VRGPPLDWTRYGHSPPYGIWRGGHCHLIYLPRLHLHLPLGLIGPSEVCVGYPSQTPMLYYPSYKCGRISDGRHYSSVHSFVGSNLLFLASRCDNQVTVVSLLECAIHVIWAVPLVLAVEGVSGTGGRSSLSVP
jgi:hypothetical protein